ncbi:hypothetical protein AAF712_015470 [Marasmius tenuissimus]|uniref:Nephrocystin 3-like N-terminal domain-containing protein n=1 Tax=Marasmius tenuissimus TaxID=585030 RepID=A0ABR2Z9C0_9AGAR
MTIPPGLQELHCFIRRIGATHDAGARDPPPRCYDGTRKSIQKRLLDWTHRSLFEGSPSQICWLYGAAGVGKTAVAQTICEKCDQEGSLAASFFFSRSDPRRNSSTSLFLHIAYQLSHKIDDLHAQITHAFAKTPFLVESSPKTQFAKLILNPCLRLSQKSGFSWSRHPSLVVIEGLDECSSKNSEPETILQIIRDGIDEGLPLRFLVCSRPEPRIKEFFDTLLPNSEKLYLENNQHSRKDITNFLLKRFADIRKDPKFAHFEFESDWPGPDVAKELGEKSSGQFLYADEVIRFITREYYNPKERLEILRCGQLFPERTRSQGDLESEEHAPFQNLDSLRYGHIMSSNQASGKVLDILGVLLTLPKLFSQRSHWVNKFSCPNTLDILLGRQKGSVIGTLRGLHAVLAVGKPESAIKIQHASFIDFLVNEARSVKYWIDEQHYSRATVGWIFGSLIDLSKRYPSFWKHDGWSQIITRFPPEPLIVSALDYLDFEGLYAFAWETVPDLSREKRWFQLFYAFKKIIGWLESASPIRKEAVARLRNAALGFHLRIVFPADGTSPHNSLIEDILNAVSLCIASDNANLRGFIQLHARGKLPGGADLIKQHFTNLSIAEQEPQTCGCRTRHARISQDSHSLSEFRQCSRSPQRSGQEIVYFISFAESATRTLQLTLRTLISSVASGSPKSTRTGLSDSEILELPNVPNEHYDGGTLELEPWTTLVRLIRSKMTETDHIRAVLQWLKEFPLWCTRVIEPVQEEFAKRLHGAARRFPESPLVLMPVSSPMGLHKAGSNMSTSSQGSTAVGEEMDDEATTVTWSDTETDPISFDAKHAEEDEISEEKDPEESLEDDAQLICPTSKRCGPQIALLLAFILIVCSLALRL